MAAWNSVGKLAPASSSKRTVLNSEKQLEKRIAMEQPVLASNPETEHQNLKQKQQQDEIDVEVDLSEVYFLIMHFLAGGPCKRATGQLWNELLQHKLLPRRYHAWHSSSGVPSGDEDDDGISFPLSYIQVMERYPHIERNHLVKLLRQQLLAARRGVPPLEAPNSRIPTAADIPTLLGVGSFSLLDNEKIERQSYPLLQRLRWPHWNCNQVHGLALRELGGGFSRHNRPPSIKSASYAIIKPSVLVDRIQITKKLRGHRNAVYCAIFDRNGQHIITGSDDRLVKIWSTETGFCLRSCRGHEGDITELSVSSSNTLVASASNDFTIRVWRLPDGVPVSVLRGHTGAVTAISFSPRQSCEHHLLSSSDDGTCRIWDARDSSVKSRVYVPKPELNNSAIKPNGTSQPTQQTFIQISCCAFNADGSIFVTGCSDKVARVWDARKWNDEITGKPNHEMDILKGHENAVNYVQFSGCGGHLKTTIFENSKEDRTQKFKNSSLSRDSIVTCSRDGSAIIWVYRARRKDARYGRWIKSYHLRVPPPPMPPNPPRGGGPRQRFLPTPRGVNMIVWSLDNRFVLAAIMDCRICVWNAVDGSLVHSLTGHTKSTFVVDVHPFNPRIAMSAGYDGRIIIWDIWEGRPVRVYETGDFQIVDGSFSPDGTSLVVSDEVGQVYLLSTGQGQSQKDAKYDQFFLGDFRALVRDVHGNVLDQETQLPPHERNIRDLLCDASMIPYPEPYQSMYQQRRLGALGIDWHPLHINLAVGIDDINYAAFGDQLPMFQLNIQRSPAENRAGGGRRWVQQPVDADEEMDWEQDTTRLSEDSESDYSASEESLSLLDDEEERSASSTEEIVQSEGEAEVDDEDEQSTEDVHPRRSNRRKRKAEDASGSYQRKVPRLPPRSNLSDESDEDGRDTRPLRQRQQDDAEPSSSRHNQKAPVVRPKRLAAKNALQMFSHIKNKGGGEEEEDDEQSSSHQDTSSYNGEQELESDGLTPRFRRKNVVAWKHEEKYEVLEGETREDMPQSIGKEAVSDDEPPITTKNETNNSRPSPRQGFPDLHQKAVSSHEESNEMFGRTVKQNTTKMLETLEAGDCSKRPRTQRRLILKLKKNEVDTKGIVSKAELEDTDSDADISIQRVDKTLVSGENTKRKLRRLIVNPPPAATPYSGNFVGFSDTVDNGDCTAVIPDNENSIQTASIFSSRSEDGRSGFDQKRQQEGDDALPTTSNPSSLSCSIDKPPSNSVAYQDGAGSPDAEAISPGKRFLQSEIQRSESSKVEKSSSPQSSIKNHVSDIGCGLPFEDAFQRNRNTDRSFENNLSNQVDLDPEVQYPQNRQWCPSFFRQRTPDAEQDNVESGVNNGAVSRAALRKGRRRIAYAIPQEVDEHIGSENVQTSEEGECRYQAPMRLRIAEEAQLDTIRGTCDNPRLVGNGMVNGSARSRRGRKIAPDVLDEHVESHQLQTSGEEDHKPTLPVHNNRRTALPQGSKRTVVIKQVMNKDNASGGMQSSSGDGFDVSQSSTEEPSGSYFGQDDASWSENDSSDKCSHDTLILKNKRGTFGEIDSTNCGDNANGRQRVRNTRSALSRAKNEGLPKGKKGRRCQRSNNNYNVDEDSDKEIQNIANRLSQSVDEQQVTNSNRRSKTDMGRSGQDGASVQIERRTLRTSGRTKIERSRVSDWDTRQQMETLPVTRDKGIRTRKSLAWLLMSEVEDGTRYIPQFGDEVAYLRQGHEEYLNMYRIDEPGPWTVYKDDLRAVEICQVVELNYAVLQDSGETCCRFTLEFSDESSELYSKTFWLTLPELTDFPDFIVEKSRYDASIQRQWTTRDRCKVWWRSQNGQGGEWWEGRVVSVKPKSLLFPDSPWERFMVQYKSDPTNPYSHSPWELFDLNEAQWEPPHVDEDTREQMLSLLESAASDPQDVYGLRRLKQTSCKSDFINRLPLPLTLDVLRQRLEKDYYHSTQAFYFDVKLLATNSEQYCGIEHPMTQGLQAFASVVHSEIFSELSS